MKKITVMIGLAAIFGQQVATVGFAASQQVRKDGFSLLDKVCVQVEGESPILLSDIKKRSQQRNISLAEAELALTRESLLWIYAKGQLKFNISEIYKTADEHIKKVIENNNLTQKKFEEILAKPPYSISLEQYKKETAAAILDNQIKSNIAGQITLTDDQVKEEVARNAGNVVDKYDILIVSIAPEQSLSKAPAGKAVNQRLTPQSKTANEIRSQILSLGSVHEINRRYGGKKNISIVGPIAYEKGTLKKVYEDKMMQNFSTVSEPFLDEGAITILWKIEKVSQNLSATALEQTRKELYEKLVMEKFQAITDTTRETSTVIVKDCGKQ